MGQEIEIKIPDIGGTTDVEVIEVLVKLGDEITIDTPLITLESDKASMEIPSSQAGKITKLLVAVGNKVSEGDVILLLKTEDSNSVIDDATISSSVSSQAEGDKVKQNTVPASAPLEQEQTSVINNLVDVCIPDIGGATEVDVIEVLVKKGDTVEKDQALVTLEGDKATMDIPSPTAGVVESINVNVNDKVSEGSLILVLQTTAKPTNKPSHSSSSQPVINKEIPTPSIENSTDSNENYELSSDSNSDSNPQIFAGPSVRRMARELGVDLSEVKGSGRKSRITKDDLKLYIKSKLSQKKSSAGFALPEIPTIDFSKFGTVNITPLNKIKRLTGINVHRSWITIPHVTQFDEADITELEQFRKAESLQLSADNEVKLTLLAFVTRVIYKALIKFPQFNASLDAKGDNLILKSYFNIGIAVETSNGLVVPVIKNVDRLSVLDIAREMGNLSKKAREKGISPADMSGGCFTISSLGGIGGTAFTPIVNSPEVAILGSSRSSIKPIYDGNQFNPRLMLPLSLSYDHRVIDGAEAARFTRYIADLLSDIRKVLL